MGAKARVLRLVKSPDNQTASSDLQLPIRTCVGCGAKRPQRVMLRVASYKGAVPVLDRSYRSPGRGAYLCCQASCMEQAFKRHALERSLKIKPGGTAALKAEIEKVLADSVNAIKTET
ncbi:MAG: YlxR family protein [Abitibacteriaceae bacterium]|nr:YlxR family protein [Abditibacteriaceae bacterium]MBV9865157.1 YlxR family protein [Abditibacteriaceae bacterium]